MKDTNLVEENGGTHNCFVWLDFFSGSGNSQGPPDFLQFEHFGSSLLHLTLRLRHSKHAARLVLVFSPVDAVQRCEPLPVLLGFMMCYHDDSGRIGGTMWLWLIGTQMAAKRDQTVPYLLLPAEDRQPRQCICTTAKPLLVTTSHLTLVTTRRIMGFFEVSGFPQSTLLYLACGHVPFLLP